eukprot:13895193-Ditylum_brightwellii.AAC.3
MEPKEINNPPVVPISQPTHQTTDLHVPKRDHLYQNRLISGSKGEECLVTKHGRSTVGPKPYEANEDGKLK